jgi:hypothetical protein
MKNTSDPKSKPTKRKKSHPEVSSDVQEFAQRFLDVLASKLPELRAKYGKLLPK